MIAPKRDANGYWLFLIIFNELSSKCCDLPTITQSGGQSGRYIDVFFFVSNVERTINQRVQLGRTVVSDLIVFVSLLEYSGYSIVRRGEMRV